MILGINDSKTILDVQERFSECFPYLKLEFYDEALGCRKGSLSEHIINPYIKIGDIRTKHDPGLLDIKSYYQTEKVEQDFKEIFGLNVHIFRLEKNHQWKQARHNEHMTLKECSELALQKEAAAN